MQPATEAAAEAASSPAVAAAGSDGAGARNLDKLQLNVEERLGISRAVYAAVSCAYDLSPWCASVEQHVLPHGAAVLLCVACWAWLRL